MTVESVPDSTPSSNSLVAEPQCLAHGPQHVCCWALQAVLGLQFGMEPDSAYLSISLLPSGSSRPFCLRSWVDRCFSFLDWIIRGWILCRGGYAGRRHAFLMGFFFFFFVSELSEVQQEGPGGALWGQRGLSSHIALGNSMESNSS